MAVCFLADRLHKTIPEIEELTMEQFHLHLEFYKRQQEAQENARN